MKALNNFLISWLWMFFIAAAATVRIVIAPVFFIFSYGNYKKSTAEKISHVRNNMKELGYVSGDYFKRYWKE
jgi:hypothetical protein